MVWPLALISWKIGVSARESRIQMAMATRTSEMMNGSRQPQSLNASVPSQARMPMIVASETTMPSVGEVCSQEV